MSGDQDEFSVTQAWLAEARQEMADKKLLGTWDYSRGDVPVDLGPGALPEGLHALSDFFDLLVGLAWLKTRPDRNPAALSGDALRDGVMKQLAGDLQVGRIVVVAPLGWPPVACNVPKTAWTMIVEEPGGEVNLMNTLSYSRFTGEAFGAVYVDQTAAVTAATYEAFAAQRRPLEDAWLGELAALEDLPDWAPLKGQTKKAWAALSGPADAEARRRKPHSSEKQICRTLEAMVREVPCPWPEGRPTAASIEQSRRPR